MTFTKDKFHYKKFGQELPKAIISTNKVITFFLLIAKKSLSEKFVTHWILIIKLNKKVKSKLYTLNMFILII